MAPEQAAGKAIDGRVDIYSVGAILYEMLTADPPHHGNNVMEILAKKATEAPTPPREVNPDVPEPLEEVVMRCLERDPDRRPQTMGALEYELSKSAKGRGSAVAAVLGLKPSEEMGGATWGEESSKPRLFDPNALSGRRPSMPSIPVGRTGITGAIPLQADEDKIRVNSSRVASRDAIAETVAMDEKKNADFKAARQQGGGWKKPVVFLGGLAFLGAAAFGAYKLQLIGTGKTVKPGAETTPAATATQEPAEAKPTPPIKTVKAPPSKEDEKMSPAEIDRMLEWARRTAEGGRIVQPRGDNLKELLDRIDKADPGNAQAEALKNRTTTALGRRGTMALKKQKLDEAEEVFQWLLALKPDDEWAKGRLARTLQLRSQRSLERNKLQAALADATAALEMAPEDTVTQNTLADVHFAQGKRELAAEEYQRVLDVKPMDKHAKLGLARSAAPKAKPAPQKAPPKKKKGGR
jgi:tetratricopeptide (TPR) repeat protein